MKSEKALPESTPLYVLLKYGLDGGSENFKSAQVNGETIDFPISKASLNPPNI
jgi:hypothetical protein